MSKRPTERDLERLYYLLRSVREDGGTALRPGDIKFCNKMVGKLGASSDKVMAVVEVAKALKRDSEVPSELANEVIANMVLAFEDESADWWVAFDGATLRSAIRKAMNMTLERRKGGPDEHDALRSSLGNNSASITSNQPSKFY